MYLAEAVLRPRCPMPLQPPANLYARYLAGDLLSPDEATAVSEYLGRMGFPGNGRGPAYGPEDELGANDALDLFDVPGSSPAGPFAGAGMQEQAPAGTPDFVPPASEGAAQEPAGGFGGSPVHLAYGGNPDGVRAMAFYNMPDLRDRARLIADRIRRDSITPKAISDARLILSQKVQEPDGSMRWEIAPKDYYAEIAKIYWATLDPNSPWAVRYMHDHPLVDTFSTYEFMSRVPAEDCDGGTIVIGTRLRAAGYPLKLRIIQTSDPGVTSFNHIYLVAGTPPLAPDDWVALDWSTGNPPGWQIDGAADLANRAQDLEPGIHLAQSEQPVGRVVAVLDVDV